jgi:glutamine amidotransferase-like uncharacterized protein
MKQKILIYRDYGQWFQGPEYLKSWGQENLINPSEFDFEFTDATSISKLNHLSFPAVKALFMPGGHSQAFARKLNGVGNKRIKDFINSGGSYLGICGGAYYACENIEFKGQYLNVLVENELNLFKCTAKGSISQLTNNTHFGNTIFSKNAVALRTKDDYLVNVFYSGGPFFIPLNDDKFTELARYDDISKPCVVQKQYGQGSVVLCAVHPEYTYEKIKDSFIPANEQETNVFQNILQKLKQSEKDGATKKFSNLILQCLAA